MRLINAQLMCFTRYVDNDQQEEPGFLLKPIPIKSFSRFFGSFEINTKQGQGGLQNTLYIQVAKRQRLTKEIN